MPDASAQKHIVIVGGARLDGWPPIKQCPADRVRVTLVESPRIGVIGVGEGFTPSLKRFFELIGVAESEWMPRCHATYKLGIRFANWSPLSGVKDCRHLRSHPRPTAFINAKNGLVPLVSRI